MPTIERPRLMPLVVLILFVCTAATGVAWILGLAANVLYMDFTAIHSSGPFAPAYLAGWLGIGSGIVAGILWCRIMIPRSIMRFRSNLPSGGTKIGVLAGVVSATILHLGLMYLAERIQIDSLIVGVVFGIIVGAVLGAVCGALCRMAVRATWPPEFPSTPESTDLQPKTDNPT